MLEFSHHPPQMKINKKIPKYFWNFFIGSYPPHLLLYYSDFSIKLLRYFIFSYKNYFFKIILLAKLKIDTKVGVGVIHSFSLKSVVLCFDMRDN